MRYRLGAYAALRWLDLIGRARDGAHLTVLYTDAEDGGRAEEFLRRFRDQSLSYVDALSLAVCEREAIDAVFAFDHHLALTGRTLLPGTVPYQ